jgi:putative addiction module component (TIGR02574 family)
MEIQIDPYNIKLSTQEYLLLFRSFDKKEQEYICEYIFREIRDSLEVAAQSDSSSSTWENEDNLEPSSQNEIEDPTDSIGLSTETQQFLDERLDSYRQNPERSSSWDDVKSRLNKKYGYGL